MVHARLPSRRPEPDDVARLIRARRAELDWSLARLARAGGLKSPAYVFHIENGTKTPSPTVARRLAAALGLDPELLIAWARARGRCDLATALSAAETLRRWLGALGDAAEPGAAALPAADPASAIAIPLLPEGADPDSGPIETRAIETLRLDRALFPPLAADARLVGYRLSAHGARRIPELLRPGDCVVVLLGADRQGPETPCAVRAGARIEIARVHAHEPAAHLPPPGGAIDSEPAETRIDPANAAAIAGRVVLVFRRWL